MPATPVLPSEASSEALPRKRFTREEVDRLIDTGLFTGQRFELIDGDLVDKMGQNPGHALSIRRILKWLVSFVEADLILVQLPIEAGGEDRERSAPEPDFAVLKEWKPEHQHRHPRGDELLLAIEVSDTSAAFDLSRKAAIYASASVPEYWVLDLIRRMLVVHRDPDGTQYRLIQLHPEDDMVSPVGRAESVRVADLLPPRS